VINTVSEAGLLGSAGNSNYAMAKAAIAALTQSIAREMGRYGVTSNFIAPRARTRMTLGTPGGEIAFAPPEKGFDAWHPAWPARFVAFLASPAAADVNGQGFVVWGSEVVLYEGWHPVATIAKQGEPFGLDELIARKDELFGSRPRAPEI
jgi:3-oxoacyl-[acyl-carrier protein] reductase